jgi:hypothetical protein
MRYRPNVATRRQTVDISLAPPPVATRRQTVDVFLATTTAWQPVAILEPIDRPPTGRRSSAPTGLNVKAQGNALGHKNPIKKPSPERAQRPTSLHFAPSGLAILI